MTKKGKGNEERPAFWVRWGTVLAVVLTGAALWVVYELMERLKETL